MVNLDLYRVFYTVAKNGSLTKAAEELYISQPAVSQSVKQLENQLGVTLFNRTHRGMELSEEGGKRIIGKVERDGITREAAEARMSNQHEDEYYTRRSHFVITNSSDLAHLEKEVERCRRFLCL